MGRGKGVPEWLYRGEVAAYKAAKAAILKHGEDHPGVQWCLRRLLDIASGDRRQPHVTTELKAITILLDRLEGRPVQAVQLQSLPADGEFRALFHDGLPIPAPAAEDLPN